MARRSDKKKAIELRKQGKTYSEIRVRLKVPKSTLSGWLGRYPLTEEQLEKLKVNVRRKKLLAVERTTLTKFKKKQKRLKNTYKSERERLLPLTKRELYLCGLFLYWGEGVKGSSSNVSLNNTDPRVVKFYHYWMTEVLEVPRERVRVAIHLYKDMSISESLDFWSNELGIPRKQFIRPYIKKSERVSINQKGFGYGTCGLYVGNRYLKDRIMAGIEAIGEYYSGKTGYI